MNTVTIITIAVVCILSTYSIYLINVHKEKLTNLSGIVISAALASMTGILSGYLVGVLSEDPFLSAGVGIIIGFVIGFLGGQPVGIMPVILGSSLGFVNGIVGALLGITMKAENPYLMDLILLVFYVLLLSLVILFIHVLANKKLVIDTKAISPFAILSAGIAVLSLFLFLYSSDIIHVNSNASTTPSQTNNETNNNTKPSTSNNSAAEITEIDVTNESTPKIKMEVTPTGYSPNLIRVKKGVPVELDIHNPLENSCLSELNIPDFHLNNVNLKVGTTTLSFTPSNTGEFTFSCGMNMYGGKIIVE